MGVGDSDSVDLPHLIFQGLITSWRSGELDSALSDNGPEKGTRRDKLASPVTVLPCELPISFSSSRTKCRMLSFLSAIVFTPVVCLGFTMAEVVRQRITGVKQELRKKSKVEGWVLPKQESSWAPPGTWTNLDLDVTPLARRTWTSLTILGYWISDIISIQSWETGSTILAVGLTWYVILAPVHEYPQMDL